MPLEARSRGGESRIFVAGARAGCEQTYREGDARTRPLNEARPSQRLDEARHASRVDSARQKPREAWEYLARLGAYSQRATGIFSLRCAAWE